MNVHHPAIGARPVLSFDEELLARAAEGAHSAVIAIYEQHRQAIYTYVYYRVGGDAALAEDLVADVFVRLVEQLPAIEYRGRPLLAWLYTTVASTPELSRRGG